MTNISLPQVPALAKVSYPRRTDEQAGGSWISYEAQRRWQRAPPRRRTDATIITPPGGSAVRTWWRLSTWAIAH
jgi:hypothetical protein